MTIAAMRGVPVTLQSAATTGNGTVLAIPANFNNHKIIIKGATGVTSGAIQPETADAYDYAGTWAPIGGGPITVAAAELEYSWIGIMKFLRVRISTDVAGGAGPSVTVTYVGN